VRPLPVEIAAVPAEDEDSGQREQQQRQRRRLVAMGEREPAADGVEGGDHASHCRGSPPRVNGGYSPSAVSASQR